MRYHPKQILIEFNEDGTEADITIGPWENGKSNVMHWKDVNSFSLTKDLVELPDGKWERITDFLHLSISGRVREKSERIK